MLKIIPLGGFGEVGKNMLIIEYENDLIIIDAGLMFPDDEMLGIDLVLPDFSYVLRNKRKVRGVFLTHGHEDHTGALPYLLKQINTPVYGTRLTLGLAKDKLAEHRMLDDVNLVEINTESVIDAGPFNVSFIHVSHSVPDGVGLAIDTPEGTIVLSGDFKLDTTPVDGWMTELNKFVKLGDRGVLLYMGDSTNAESPGGTKTEKSVGEALDRVFKDALQRVVVCCFSSHIHRIQQVLDMAYKNDRKVAIAGRSMRNNVQIATELGYLNIPGNTIIGLHEVNDYPPYEIVIIATGSQGEPMSALARLASHDHKHIKLVPGDTVVLSATPVPGNEKSVARTIDQLFRIGTRVFYEEGSGVHVSGHASREELRLMLSLVKPKYFIPMHGEYRHLKHHTDLASSMGIPKENIFIVENGNVVTFKQGKAQPGRNVSAGAMFVDGLGIGDIGDVVLRDRMRLSRDGVFIVVVGINRQTGQIISGPDIVSRGFVYPKETKDLIEEAKTDVIATLEQCASDSIIDESVLKMHIRDSLSRYLFKSTRRRPMVMPVIMEV